MSSDCGHVCGIPEDAHQTEEHPFEAEARADVDGLVAALQGLDAPFRWLQENYPKAFVEMPTPYFRALDKARLLLAGDKAEAPE